MLIDDADDRSGADFVALVNGSLWPNPGLRTAPQTGQPPNSGLQTNSPRATNPKPPVVIFRVGGRFTLTPAVRAIGRVTWKWARAAIFRRAASPPPDSCRRRNSAKSNDGFKCRAVTAWASRTGGGRGVPGPCRLALLAGGDHRHTPVAPASACGEAGLICRRDFPFRRQAMRPWLHQAGNTSHFHWNLDCSVGKGGQNPIRYVNV